MENTNMTPTPARTAAPIHREHGVDVYYLAGRYKVYDQEQAGGGWGGGRFAVTQLGHGVVAEFDDPAEAITRAQELQNQITHATPPTTERGA